MAITHQDDANVTAYTTGSVAITIDVAIGDLIVVFIGTMLGATYCTGVTDDIGNTYTIRTAITQSGSSVVFAYVLSSAGADATNVITATFNNATVTQKSIIASCYQPDGGDTVTLDDSSNNSSTWQASPWDTLANAINTTGTDEVLVAAFQTNGTRTYTNHEIPSGTAAIAFTAAGPAETCFYRILSATLSNGEGEVDVSAGAQFCAEILAFKSVAGGTTHQLAGSLNSASQLTGLLNLTQRLSGSLNSTSHVSGVLRLIQRLSGSLNSSSVVSGTFRLIHGLSGAVQSASQMAGSLRLTQRIKGALNSISALNGILRLIQRISGSLNSTTHLSGNLSVPTTHSLSGSLNSTSHLSGTLTEDRIQEIILASGTRTLQLTAFGIRTTQLTASGYRTLQLTASGTKE